MNGSTDSDKFEAPIASLHSAFALHVACEIQRARAKHKPINSAHEGYAVILEELDEFWDEVKKSRELRDKRRMYDELVQIAAMAQRTAEDVMEREKPNESSSATADSNA